MNTNDLIKLRDSLTLSGVIICAILYVSVIACINGNYQSSKPADDQPMTNKRPANDQPMTTSKESNKAITKESNTSSATRSSGRKTVRGI